MIAVSDLLAAKIVTLNQCRVLDLEYDYYNSSNAAGDKKRNHADLFGGCKKGSDIFRDSRFNLRIQHIPFRNEFKYTFG